MFIPALLLQAYTMGCAGLRDFTTLKANLVAGYYESAARAMTVRRNKREKRKQIAKCYHFLILFSFALCVSKQTKIIIIIIIIIKINSEFALVQESSTVPLSARHRLHVPWLRRVVGANDLSDDCRSRQARLLRQGSNASAAAAAPRLRCVGVLVHDVHGCVRQVVDDHLHAHHRHESSWSRRRVSVADRNSFMQWTAVSF